jgi:septal ring factor EnvC (AmiA/AmiB activator)
MVILVALFPAAVWFLADSDARTNVTKANAETSAPAAGVDLNVAADQTIRKISEIDAKISATKDELARHEDERRKMASELVRIQNRISEVLDRKQAYNR